MFCPNCGKQVKDNDNFCRYCGAGLKEESSSMETFIEKPASFETQKETQADFSYQSCEKNSYEKNFDRTSDVKTSVETKNTAENENEIEIPEYDFPKAETEELVLYDVKKHYMALFWPIVLTPVFFVYFWQIFLNTHSFFSWVVAFAILTPIVYPILRYSSDKIIITNQFMHIKTGVIKPQEVDIPLRRAAQLPLEQTTVGRMLNYGTLVFKSNLPDRDSDTFGYIKDFDEFAAILDNPAEFVRESLDTGY